MKSIPQFLTQIGVMSAHPAAFLIVIIYTLLWVVFEPKSFDWHAVATLATWMMTLFIQRAEHRDTQAIHAKLDELLRVDVDARTEISEIDEEEPEEIEKARENEKKTT